MTEAGIYDAEEKLHINISTSAGHQRLHWGGCSMLLTSCTCSTIYLYKKIKHPKLGRFSNLILVLIFVAGINHGSNPPSNLISVLILILMADISHGSNPPSNLILVSILVAGLSHGSNPPSKLILNMILILIWNLKLNLILNLILILILVAGLSHHTN